MKKVVWCTFDVPGLHFWKDAPNDVAFLRNEHRHLFKIRVEVKVEDLDREVEFLTLLSRCKQCIRMVGEWLSAGYQNFVGRSCEQIAEQLKFALNHLYHEMTIAAIEVSEDGENGCRLEW